MKPHFCILLFLTAYAAPAAAEVNTFKEALAIAYQHNPELAAERAKLRATDEQVAQALSNYRPSIDATFEGGKTREDIAEGGFFSGSNTLTPRNGSVNITQPVFRGLRTSGSVNSAKASVKAERAALENTEQQLLLDTSKAYMDVLQAQVIVELNSQNITNLQQQLAITRDRYKVGDLTKTDASQAESRLQVAQATYLMSKNELANRRAAFSRLVGQSPGMLRPPILILTHPSNLAEAVTMAEQDNPNVIAATYNRKAAESDVTVAEGSLLPEVSLVGSAERAKDQDPTIPQREDSFSIIAKLTIPLYRSGSDYSKVRAAKQTVGERSMEFQDASNKAKESALTAWQTLTTTQDAITVDKGALAATDQALYGVKEEAKVGMRTTLDVLNAEQESLNARINLVKAMHDEAMAILQVRAAVGKLTAEAMNLPVTLYDPKANYDKVHDQWIGWNITK